VTWGLATILKSGGMGKTGRWVKIWVGSGGVRSGQCVRPRGHSGHGVRVKWVKTSVNGTELETCHRVKIYRPGRVGSGQANRSDPELTVGHGSRIKWVNMGHHL